MNEEQSTSQAQVATARADLIAGKDMGIYLRFIVSAMGSVPWVGGLLAASSALSAELAQQKANHLLANWIAEHEDKIAELREGIEQIIARVDAFGHDAKERMQDEHYLTVVRKAFGTWDRCETKVKREYVFTLLTNAAAIRLVADDVVRIFLDWIETYYDAHFAIIRAIYKNKGITRLGIWKQMGKTGPLPAENSSEADLYRMLIHDLSTGRVIRQERVFDGRGFLKEAAANKLTYGKARPSRESSPYQKSSWDDEEPYELTELGKEFVQYVLQEAVPRISA